MLCHALLQFVGASAGALHPELPMQQDRVSAVVQARDAQRSMQREHTIWLSKFQSINTKIVPDIKKPGPYPTDLLQPEVGCARDRPLEEWGGSRNAALTELRSNRANYMNESAYQACPQPSLNQPGCVVYSCGIGEDPTFEIDIARKTACEVFAFDPSPIARRWLGRLLASAEPSLPPNLRFVPWGWFKREIEVEFDPDEVASGSLTQSMIGLEGHHISWHWNTKEWGRAPHKWSLKPLSTIARIFNHTKVDLVKIDCEGPEYGLVEDLLTLQPDQIILEQHPHHPVVIHRSRHKARSSTSSNNKTLVFKMVRLADWINFPEQLHAAGYRQVWRGHGDEGWYGEYTWAQRSLTNSDVL